MYEALNYLYPFSFHTGKLNKVPAIHPLSTILLYFTSPPSQSGRHIEQNRRQIVRVDLQSTGLH